MIYAELFFSFLKIGLFSIGGGYAAMPLIESIVVDKYAWLTVSRFGDLVTIAEMTPGPILVNGATFVGIQVAGILGAVVATLGAILPSLVIVTALSYFYYKYKTLSSIKTVLKTIRPAIVALIACAGASILINAVFGSYGFSLKAADFVFAAVSAVAFAAVRKLKLSPIITIFSCGAIYTVVQIVMEKA